MCDLGEKIFSQYKQKNLQETMKSFERVETIAVNMTSPLKFTSSKTNLS